MTDVISSINSIRRAILEIMNVERPLTAIAKPRSSTAKIREAALAALEAGLCPVPPRMDGSKAPIGDWGQYQQERPSHQQIESWYGSNTGVGLVCGKISGNLECLEFDDSAAYNAYKGLAAATDLGELLERIEAGYLEQSPSGASTGYIGVPQSLATRS
jgi:hypothetical protein